MNILIVEDETAAAVNLKAILRKVLPEHNILGVLETIEESVEYFQDESQTRPDLVFMDIHLADGESFRIFDSVEIDSPIIFTTAYDEYALRAFKVNSIDYILKPIKADDLILPNDAMLAEDFKGNQLLLFASMWSINWTADRNKNIRLLEFGGAQF
jgi:DNA-binding LytR/AlgR family response regulator